MPGHSGAGFGRQDDFALPAAFREQAFNIIAAAFGRSLEAEVFSRPGHRFEHPIWGKVRGMFAMSLGWNRYLIPMLS